LYYNYLIICSRTSTIFQEHPHEYNNYAQYRIRIIIMIVLCIIIQQLVLKHMLRFVPFYRK